MKRFFVFFSFSVFLIFLISIFFYFAFPFFLAKVVSSKIGAKVGFEKIVFKTDKVLIKSAVIRNGPKFTRPNALSVKAVEIQAPCLEYLHEDIHIKRLKLSDVILTIEFLDKKHISSNWDFVQSDPHPSNKFPSPSRNSKREAFIEHFDIYNMKVVIVSPGSKTTIQTIPALHYKNIKTQEGELTKRLAQTILYYTIFNVRNILNFPAKMAEDAIDGFFNKFDYETPNTTQPMSETSEPRPINQHATKKSYAALILLKTSSLPPLSG